MSIENKILWNNVLAQIELTISKANFGMWFKGTHIIKIDSGVVSLGVPNVFVKDWLMNKYHKDIIKNLRNFNENVRSVEYSVSKGEKEEPVKEGSTAIDQLPLNELYIKKTGQG